MAIGSLSIVRVLDVGASARVPGPASPSHVIPAVDSRLARNLSCGTAADETPAHSVAKRRWQSWPSARSVPTSMAAPTLERRLEALHRIVHPRRNHQAVGAGRRRDVGRAQPGARQHRDRAERAHHRQHRRLSRVHRHDRREILKLDTGAAAGRAQRRSSRRWGSRSRCRSASTTPTRWRCAATTRAPKASPACPI